MATTFESLYRRIRAPLGDVNTKRLLYSDDVLADYLRLLILSGNNAAVLEDETLVLGDVGFPSFTQDLSTVNKALLIFGAIRAIISPQANYFSYKTPIHSVTKSGHVSQLLAWVTEQLDGLQGGAFSWAADNELDAAINDSYRFLRTVTDSISEMV